MEKEGVKLKGLSGLVAAGLLAFASTNAGAQSIPADLHACQLISANEERLQCYDRVFGRNDDNNPRQGPKPLEAVNESSAFDNGKVPLKTSSRMAEHWELDDASKRGAFYFRPHRENYLVGTYNSDPNDAPYRPFRLINPDAELSRGELAFQLSFKLKFAEKPANLPVDVWFGYTQRSFWQAGNQEASSPFRETNYQPELMAVVPTNLNLLGLRLRFLNLGLEHQSNGQGSLLSRSWNRAYLQAGLEKDDFELLVRAWKRFKEDADEDNNPRITDYLGHGDIVGTYRWNGHELSLLMRHNFNTDKGAAQLGWAFPLSERLKGYVQFFSGYGYSLIDYNVSQRILGLGVKVSY